MKKTSLREFASYKKWVKYYLDLFKINEYQLYFELEQIDTYAQINVNNEGHVVVFTLSEEKHHGWSNVRRYALHEVLHLLSSKLDYLTRQRYITAQQAQNEWECLVCKLQDIIERLEQK